MKRVETCLGLSLRTGLDRPTWGGLEDTVVVKGYKAAACKLLLSSHAHECCLTVLSRAAANYLVIGSGNQLSLVAPTRSSIYWQAEIAAYVGWHRTPVLSP